MSTRKAAERLRRVNDGEDCDSVYGEEWYHGELKDRVTLADAYLRELDPSPISPSLLKAEGWAGSDKSELYHLGNLSVFSMGNGQWTFARNSPAIGVTISTMGHVRTLVRLSHSQGEHA